MLFEAQRKLKAYQEQTKWFSYFAAFFIGMLFMAGFSEQFCRTDLHVTQAILAALTALSMWCSYKSGLFCEMLERNINELERAESKEDVENAKLHLGISLKMSLLHVLF